jgi:regulator of sigma E protease
MTILYVLLAILLLAILIVVHEFGHFIFARVTGIEVMEFSVGFGPKLWGRKSKKGTQFSIRAIPLGGYCAFYGEDDVNGEHVDDPRAYNKQSVWKRMLSVLMGPGMNFVLAIVVAVMFYWIGGIAHVTGYEPYIAEVAATGPAYSAGLQDGDIIESINGVNMLDGTQTTLLNTIAAYQDGDDPLELVVRRGDETFTTTLTPFYDEDAGKYRIGVTVSAYVLSETSPATFTEAVSAGWNWCNYAGGVILNALKNLVTTGEGLDQTSGPVGVVSMVTTQVQEGGFEAFISLLIVISINLGIMNLLPIPGLDGSRFLFMVLEAIRRKPVPPQKEAMVHLCGYILLFALMIFFTFKDVIRLFN